MVGIYRTQLILLYTRSGLIRQSFHRRSFQSAHVEQEATIHEVISNLLANNPLAGVGWPGMIQSGRMKLKKRR